MHCIPKFCVGFFFFFPLKSVLQCKKYTTALFGAYSSVDKFYFFFFLNQQTIFCMESPFKNMS